MQDQAERRNVVGVRMGYILEVKGEDYYDEVEVNRLGLTTLDMWCLGITIVVGGEYVGWNASLDAGFGNVLVATFLMATAYICLVFCIAELSSALPFAGNMAFLYLLLIWMIL